MYTEDDEPASKRPLNVAQRPAQQTARPMKQTTLPNLIVIQQEPFQQVTPQKATPRKPVQNRVPPENTTIVTPKPPRILNQGSRVLNVSAKQFKSPDLLTKEDGGIELILSEEIDDELEDVPKQVETAVFPCTECNRAFSLQQMLDIHMEQHKKVRSSECDYCQKKFFTKYDLSKHMITHAEVKPFQCSICNKGFSRSMMLSRHEKTHTETPHYVCSFCKKTFLSIDDLEKHDLNHRKNRPFQCAYCEKSFTFKQGLERHEIKHTEKPFKCEYCNAGFPTATTLSRHLSRHAGRRPYPCRLCPNSYLLSHHLSRHLRSHKAATNSTFICNHCPDTFNSLNQLILHLEVHIENEYICPLCNEELPGPDELAEHMVLHTGEQFACEFCDLIFVEEDQKNNHCDVEHAAEQAEYENDTKTRTVQEVVTPDSVEIIELKHVESQVIESEDIVDTKPRRGRPPKAKPNILNFMNSNSPEEKLKKEAESPVKSNEGTLTQADDLMDYEFDYVDVIQKEEPKQSKPTVKSTPPMSKKSKDNVPQKKFVPSPNANASVVRKDSVSPVKKISPVKHVPIAQQKLEQQLLNAMKKTPPAPVTNPPHNKPILTKVNFKKLPPGVTVKKMNTPNQQKSSPSTNTPKNVESRPPSAGTSAKKPPAGSSSASPAAQPPMQRVRMTQAQVDAMAKEGKIQMKNGQVFLRNVKHN